MAGVCFYFEDEDVDVWSGKDLDAWNYACMAAGDIDKIVVVNRTEQVIPSPGGQYDFQVVSTLDAANFLPGRIAQLVCPWNDFNSYPLWTYDHAVDWYVFGPAAGWANVAIPGADQVCIPMNGMGALHSVHAATVVMLHRYSVVG